MLLLYHVFLLDTFAFQSFNYLRVVRCMDTPDVQSRLTQTDRYEYYFIVISI